MSLARRLRRKHANATMDWGGGVVAIESQAAGEPASAMAVWMKQGQVLGQRQVPAPRLHKWDSRGLAFFLPENTEHFIRHRDRILPS